MAMTSFNSKLHEQLEKDRVITSFPRAYDLDATPYRGLDYDPVVKNACQRDRTNVGVRTCKAVVIGDVGVGKTSLVNRFCHNSFDKDYKATIGVDFEVEKFSVLSCPFTLQLWDTAGQERFKCIAASYYRGANILIVTFDLTDVNSLTGAKNWYKEAIDSADNPLVFLVGLKRDMVTDGVFRDIERYALQTAREIEAEFWPTSSKTGDFVQKLFFRVVGVAFNKSISEEMSEGKQPNKAIGNGLGVMKKENLYDKRKVKMKCSLL